MYEKKILQNVQTNWRNERKLSKHLIRRIMNLHEIGLTRFKEDIRIWLSYIGFCTQTGHVELVTKTFPLMLQLHKKDSNLWIAAAKWELTQYNNLKKALDYLYEGIKFNPASESLYLYVNELELEAPMKKNYIEYVNLDLVEKQRRAENKAIKLVQMAEDHIFDVDFYIEVLKKATRFIYTTDLQEEICGFIRNNKFEKDANAWDTLALRELNGHHITERNYRYINDRDEKIKNCIRTYEYGIQKHPSKLLWEKYIDTLINFIKNEKPNEFIMRKFEDSCYEAHKNCFLTENQYLVWLDHIKNRNDYPDILKTATEKQPGFTELWCARVMYCCTMKQEHLIDSIFNEAFKALGENGLRIWQRKIQFYVLRTEDLNKIESIYREGIIKTCPKISFALQPQYLEWLALFRTGDKMREVYKELTQRQPFCLELHKKMAELESMTANPDEEIYAFIKKYFEEYPRKEWNEYVTRIINDGNFLFVYFYFFLQFLKLRLDLIPYFWT